MLTLVASGRNRSSPGSEQHKLRVRVQVGAKIMPRCFAIRTPLGAIIMTLRQSPLSDYSLKQLTRDIDSRYRIRSLGAQTKARQLKTPWPSNVTANERFLLDSRPNFLLVDQFDSSAFSRCRSTNALPGAQQERRAISSVWPCERGIGASKDVDELHGGSDADPIVDTCQSTNDRDLAEGHERGRHRRELVPLGADEVGAGATERAPLHGGS